MLGNNIFNLRKKAGISQEELGEKIGVTRQTISNWELGETTPNPEQLKSLSKLLNITIDELVDNEIKDVLTQKITDTEKKQESVLKYLKLFVFTFIGVGVGSILLYLLFHLK